MKKNLFNANLLVLLLFAIISCVGIVHHDMWRDEWQAILLSYKSRNIIDLWHNMRDEGHPMLWYILLFIGRYMGPPTIIPKLINYMLALGYAAIIIRYSPFKSIVRYSLVFGYFLLFEYGIISRNYALSILLIVSIMALWPVRSKYLWAFATLLFLLTQTTVYGAMMALSFALILLTESYFKHKEFKVNLQNATYSIVAIGGTLICYLCAQRVSFDTGVNVALSGDHFLYTLSTLYNSYLPVPEFSHNCWNSILPNGIGDLTGYQLRGILAIALITFAVTFLWKHKSALIFWLSYTIAQLTFTYIYFIGYSRQMGYLFIAGIVAFWFVYIDPALKIRLTLFHKSVVGVIIGIQVLTGLYFVYDSISFPFIESREVVNYLKENKLSHLPVYGSYHYCMTGISGYLDKPVIHLDDMHPYTFMPWEKLKHSREQQSDSFLNLRIPAILSEHDSAIVLLTYTSNAIDTLPKTHVQLLQTFNNSNELFENFNVYLLKK